MPFYDRQCNRCGVEIKDRIEAMRALDFPCEVCGGLMKRAVWIGKANSVAPDDIPGGVEIRHGLCNEDGTPRRYYSKSEMAAEALKRGLTNHVVHVPMRGSDKSPHTTRWDAMPAYMTPEGEQDRLAGLRAFEVAND